MLSGMENTKNKVEDGLVTINPSTADRDVRRMRDELCMTAQELSEAAGVSVTTVSRWENGRTQPSRLALAQLQKIWDSRRRKKG